MWGFSSRFKFICSWEHYAWNVIIRFYFIPLTVCDIRQTTVVVYRSMNKKCEYIFVQLIVMYLLNMLEMLRFMFARRIGSLVVVARALYQVVRFRAVAIGY